MPKAVEKKHDEAGAPAPASPKVQPQARLDQIHEFAAQCRAFDAQVRGIVDETRSLMLGSRRAEANVRRSQIAPRTQKLAEMRTRLAQIMDGAGDSEPEATVLAGAAQLSLQNAGLAIEALEALFLNGPKANIPAPVAPEPRRDSRPVPGETFVVFVEGQNGEEIKLSDSCSVFGNRKARLTIDELRLLSKRVKYLVKIPPILFGGGLHVILATSREIDIPGENPRSRAEERRD